MLDVDYSRFVPPSSDHAPVTREEAEEYLLAQLDEQAERPRLALWSLASFYVLTRRPELGRTYFDRVLNHLDEGNERALACRQMATLLEQIEAWDDAITLYERAAALETKTSLGRARTQSSLGECLAQLGRYDEAERACRRALQIDPEREDAHKNLGLSLEGLGRAADAARSYMTAIELNAADPRAMRHLEALLEAHPELAPLFPDLDAQLAECRSFVASMKQLRRDTAA